MLTLLRKSATLLKYVSEDISISSSSLIDVQSKLIPILASIILYCSNNIEIKCNITSSDSSSSSNSSSSSSVSSSGSSSGSSSRWLHELIQAIDVFTVTWLQSKDKVPNYFHTYRQTGYLIIIISFIIFIIIVSINSIHS